MELQQQMRDKELAKRMQSGVGASGGVQQDADPRMAPQSNQQRSFDNEARSRQQEYAMELQQQMRQREISNRTQFTSGVFALFPIFDWNKINLAGNDDFNSGQVGGFIHGNTDVYSDDHGPDYLRHHRDVIPESVTSPRRVPTPSVRNGFNPPDLGAIVQKERQQLEYADMPKQQMREREESKAAAKHAKRVEEEAELDRAPQQPVKSFAKQKVSGLSLEKLVNLKTLQH
jgi:hypothetical protein